MKTGHIPTGRADRRSWLGLAALALPTLVIGLDMTVLHLAASSIARELRPSETSLLWIVDVYGFAVAGLLLTMGNVGDRIGRRRLLMIGAAGFAVASTLAAFAPGPGWLIAARALLGVAGATLMPSTLSLIRDLFTDDRQRTRAVAIWLAALLTGGALGPLVGGIVLEFAWWGAVFLLAVPVMVALLVVGPILLPAGRAGTGGTVDWVSVVLSLLAVLPLIYTVKELAAHGVAPVQALLVVLGVGAGVAFVRRQRRLPQPLLDLSLFRNARFSGTLTAHLVALLAVGGLQYLFALYLQLVLGFSPIVAGLWMLPGAVLGLIGPILAPGVAERVTPVPAIAVGLTLGVPGAVLLALASPSDPTVAVVGFAVLSFALNFATALTTDHVVSAAPGERAGMAAGINETGSELGIALGVALLGSVATAVQTGVTDEPLTDGASGVVREAFLSGVQTSAVAATVALAVVTLVFLRTARTRPASDRDLVGA